jgi:hypothetical protein
MGLNVNGGPDMTRLATNLLNATGLYLGLVAPHPRQLSTLANGGALPRPAGMPSAFRRR